MRKFVVVDTSLMHPEAWIYTHRCPDCGSDILGELESNESVWCPMCEKQVYPPTSLNAPARQHKRVIKRRYT